MGSPLAPTLANIFMNHFEKQHMEEMRKLGVKFWVRYVDDTFVLLENKQQIDYNLYPDHDAHLLFFPFIPSFKHSSFC